MLIPQFYFPSFSYMPLSFFFYFLPSKQSTFPRITMKRSEKLDKKVFKMKLQILKTMAAEWKEEN